MSTLIYKIKNKLFRLTKEAAKVKRPSYEELVKYKTCNYSNDSKFILSFGAGRCGQNWFAKIFNSHYNWIGTSERFSNEEAFYRFISYYNLPIEKEAIYQLFELARNRDLSKYNNSFIASPYLSFGVQDLCERLQPNYLFFNLRDPVKSVESFHRKGWYSKLNNFEIKKSPIIDISINLKRSFSRVIPKNDYLNEWLKLTNIGKIAWYWATVNKAIFDDFKKLNNIEKHYFKLEDIDQNYNFYLNLVNKFNLKNQLKEKDFYNIINKTPNRGPKNKYKFNEWNKLEKLEFENIINKIFPDFHSIKTTI